MKITLRELVGNITRVFITHRKVLLQNSQNFGLYVGQPQILSFIRSHPGCTQNEIAAYLGVSPASIAFSTKRLQTAGFLQKQINSLNMRCNRLYITPEGTDAMDRFGTCYDEMNQRMFDGFSDEELTQVMSFTERVYANLQKMTEEEQNVEKHQKDPELSQ